MNNFLNNIVLRHTKPANQVLPRLRGVFEQDNPGSAIAREDVFAGAEKEIESVQNLQTFAAHNNMVPASDIPSGPDKSDGNSTDHFFSPEHMINKKEDQQQSQNIEQPSSAGHGILNDIGRVKQREPLHPPLMREKKDDPIPPFKFVNEEHTMMQDRAMDGAGPSPSGHVIRTVQTPGQTDRPAGNNIITPLTVLNNTRPSAETLSWLKNFKTIINQDAAGKSTLPAPVIKVSIGRIDVRASTPQAPVKTKADPRPGMTLDEFLKKKNGMEQ